MAAAVVVADGAGEAAGAVVVGAAVAAGVVVEVVGVAEVAAADMAGVAVAAGAIGTAGHRGNGPLFRGDSDRLNALNDE